MSRSHTPLTELFSTLKGYINQLSAGDKSPAEVGSALNDWARDSAESIKSKIQEEVEASVSKMGFIKRDEFESLRERLEKAESELLALKSPDEKSPDKKSPDKKATTKKSAARVIKKSAATKRVKEEK